MDIFAARTIWYCRSTRLLRMAHGAILRTCLKERFFRRARLRTPSALRPLPIGMRATRVRSTFTKRG